jgi:hypothetical protein
MCRFAYLAVAFRGEPPEDAARLVERHGEAARRPLKAIRPQPDSTLARFGQRCAVVATFRCAHCACGWGPKQAEQMKRVAASLLQASDVLRVRIGIWWISAGFDAADPHATDAPVELREVGIDAADVSRFGGRSSWQLELSRSGPPWPTKKLAQIDPSEAPA